MNQDIETELQAYLELQAQKKAIDELMEQKKKRLVFLLRQEGTNRYTTTIGQVTVDKQTRTSFDNKLLESFLSPQQLEEAKRTTEFEVVRILSAEALEKRQSFATKENVGGKQNE